MELSSQFSEDSKKGATLDQILHESNVFDVQETERIQEDVKMNDSGGRLPTQTRSKTRTREKSSSSQSGSKTILDLSKVKQMIETKKSTVREAAEASEYTNTNYEPRDVKMNDLELSGPSSSNELYELDKGIQVRQREKQNM